MSSGFRAMLGVAVGTFLITVLAVAGAALGVAAFTGIQGPWPEGPVAQALAAFSRNGTLAVAAVVLLLLIGCLPGIGPRSWASLNPIVRRTSGVRGISVSDLLDISVARAVGFVAAVALLAWAAPSAGLAGPETTAPVADLPAPAAVVTALAALVLLSLPYAVGGLFSLRRESEFVDDYRIRPYDATETDQDDWRQLRERESGRGRSRRTPPVPVEPIIEPLFPGGVIPGSAEPAREPVLEPLLAPRSPEPVAPEAEPAVVPVAMPDPVPVASGDEGDAPADATSQPSPVGGAVPVPAATPTPAPTPPPIAPSPEHRAELVPAMAAAAVRLADLEEPVLVFTVAADPADPVMVFSPASGVEPRIAPPLRRVRPAYTPASRVKSDDLLAPTTLFRDRRVPAVAAQPVEPAAPVPPAEGPAAEIVPVAAAAVPKKGKKKGKGRKKKSGQSPVNVTVHVHMPPSA